MKKILMAAVLTAVAATASAQQTEYPQKPVKMLLPFAAGGGGDALGRLLSDRMSKRLNQPFIVENKPGVAGTLGTHAAAVAPPDGYTISIGGMSTHLLAPAIYPKLPYDPLKSFVPVGRIGTSSILMVATNDYPANNLKEFLALAKAKPGTAQYASWGQGSTGHFCAEVLAQKTGVKLVHVPYKGAAQIMTDMLGGHIPVGFVDMATGTPFVKDGKLKALAVCTQRSPSLPNVASYKDQGVDFDQLLSWVMYLPAGTPAPIVDKIAGALKETLAEQDVAAKMLALGITAGFMDGKTQAEENARDIPMWKKIAVEANITAD